VPPCDGTPRAEWVCHHFDVVDPDITVCIRAPILRPPTRNHLHRAHAWTAGTNHKCINGFQLFRTIQSYEQDHIMPWHTQTSANVWRTFVALVPTALESHACHWQDTGLGMLSCDEPVLYFCRPSCRCVSPQRCRDELEKQARSTGERHDHRMMRLAHVSMS
jgi:hypothetical protein